MIKIADVCIIKNRKNFARAFRSAGCDKSSFLGSDKSNMVEIDDSGINVKFKTDGKMISDAKLLWTPDKYIKSMEDVGIALASSGFDFLKGNQQRLGKCLCIIMKLIIVTFVVLYINIQRKKIGSMLLHFFAKFVCEEHFLHQYCNQLPRFLSTEWVGNQKMPTLPSSPARR